MSVQALIDSKLVMVTGKGGTGKTTYAAALAVLAAAKGRRTLLCEVDNQRPSLSAIFGTVPGHEPREVRPGLSVCNVKFAESLGNFVRRMVPVGRVVNLVLENKIVNRFLDFTPGSRELVTMSRIGQLTEQFDVVIVDMPASGHAFSLLDILRSAIGLFRSGPVRELAHELRKVILDTSSRMVFVAIPEEMVVNETLETHARMKDGNLIGGDPVVFLNRATLPSLTDDERELIRRLSTRPDTSPLQAEFVKAGRWEDELEQATAVASDRLSEAFGAAPVLVPPSGAGGIPRHVVAGVAVHLGRHVGVTKRDLPWI